MKTSHPYSAEMSYDLDVLISRDLEKEIIIHTLIQKYAGTRHANTLALLLGGKERAKRHLEELYQLKTKGDVHIQEENADSIPDESRKL